MLSYRGFSNVGAAYLKRFNKFLNNFFASSTDFVVLRAGMAFQVLAMFHRARVFVLGAGTISSPAALLLVSGVHLTCPKVGLYLTKYMFIKAGLLQLNLKPTMENFMEGINHLLFSTVSAKCPDTYFPIFT